MASESNGVRILGFTFNHASNAIFLIQAAMVCLYGGTTRFSGLYAPTVTAAPSDGSSIAAVVWTTLMVFAGLAYITIASSRYLYNSIAYTFFYVATAIEWGILMLGFWQQSNLSRVIGAGNRGGWGWTAIELDAAILINALYMAANCIVAFGAVAGRISFMGGFAMVFLNLFAATANFQIGGEIKINDFGGPSSIHLWGATFGLVVSFMLRNKADRELTNQTVNRHTGSFALIGTALLFVIYPIFNTGNLRFLTVRNAGVAPAAIVSAAEFRGVFNTVMALCSSVGGAFMASKAISPNGDSFKLREIQHAAVAGGVAIASTAPLLKNPWGALLVGALAGFFSATATAYWVPFLARLGIQDSTGVFAAHFVPGILAALSSSVANARVVTDDAFDAVTQAIFVFDGRSAVTQGGHQMAYALITIVFAALWGLIIGFILNFSIFNPKPVTAVDDAEEWVDLEDGLENFAVEDAAAAPVAAPEAAKVSEVTAAAPAPAPAAAPATETA